MKVSCLLGVLAVFLITILPAGLSFADSDEFIGDTAIYSGESGSRNLNVLFIVDNSNAAANNSGPSAEYDPETEYSGIYNRFDIWKSGQQGEFTHLESANSSSALGNLTCSNNGDIIRNSLNTFGTYTGRGTAEYPSIKNGGCDTNKAYTYALGNYLNYLNTPPEDLDVGESASQASIFARAIELVLDTKRVMNGLRVGLMVYQDAGNKGGKVVAEVADLSDDGNYQNFLDRLPGGGGLSDPGFLSSQTARPQAEALLDAGWYFRGKSLPVSGQLAMPSPITNWCDENLIILVTNGLSNKDDDSALATLIGDYDHDGQEASAYGLGTHYLDDVAKFLYETDAVPDSGTLPSGVSSHLLGMQRIRTATILAFQNEDPLVRRAGLDREIDADSGVEVVGDHGRGGYYNVFSLNQLQAALEEVFLGLAYEVDTSFVAPVVPASSTNRTISSDRVYLGLFKPQTKKPWLGNLKKYKVSSQNSLIGVDGQPATADTGDFLEGSRSFWGTDSTGQYFMQMPPPLADPYDPNDNTRPIGEGDGGVITAGGVGGTLLARDLTNDPRKIYTYLGGANKDLTDSSNAFNKTNITAANTGIANDDIRNKLVDYLYGWDSYDDDMDSLTNDRRPWILGDILHSKPLVINYTNYSDNQESVCYQDDATGNSSMIFVGANDGMLHAFRDCDGGEEWAFIPDVLLPKLDGLLNVSHTYYVDSPPTAYIHDKNNDGNIDPNDDKIIILFGMRRGGGSNNLLSSESRGAYYALDVTTYNAPKLLWKLDVADFGELGETWSQPRLTKMKIDGAVKVVAWFGAGYDNNEDLRFGNTQNFPDDTGDATEISSALEGKENTTSLGSGGQHNPRGRGVFAVEVALLNKVNNLYTPNLDNSGDLLWSFTNALDGTNMKYSIPSNLTILDVDANGYHDRIYVGDTGGQIWRFDIGDNSTSNWTGNVIFRANSGSTNGKKIFYNPAVRLDGTQAILYFGTGDREHPLNTAVVDRMYSIFDKGQGSSDQIDESDLLDLTTNELQENDTTAAEITSILTSLRASSNYGWRVDLNLNPGEKVLASPVLFNKVVFFTTYAPDLNVFSSPDPCSPGNLGTSRLYQLDYDTAEAVNNFDESNDSSDTSGNQRADMDGVALRRSDRVKEIGQGIPSGIVTLIDASGVVTMMVSSSNKVGTYAAPDSKLISPVYWMTW